MPGIIVGRDEMASTRVTVFVFAATMGLAGFLLFQVQPVMAKYILPWFGGSAMTWIVCMLFFQVALLVGYAYAYAVTRPFRVTAQAKAQVALLFLVLLLLPITPADSSKPLDSDYPFVFERFISSVEQTRWWSYAFVGYAILFSVCAAMTVRRAKGSPEEPVVPTAGGR